MNNDDKVVFVRIAGHVQGVGFRAFVLNDAERLGVRGWVRNRQNGDVEALVAGAPAAIEALIAVCRRGPPHARVSNIVIQEPTLDLLGGLPMHGFELRPTI